MADKRRSRHRRARPGADVPDVRHRTWHGHAPGAETATLEVEKLNEGLRVILPKIELWGIVE
ncbi:MAG: hypothetical protein CO096_34450, partial [Armatimonadetes bacterium CG_4_9_14_3_um_filter_66_14]